MTMLFKNRLNQIGLLLFLCSALIMTSCDKDTEDILEEEGITLADLVGKWSITNETKVVTDAAGTQIRTENEDYGHNLRTIEFKQNETFLFIGVEDSEWGTGDFTLDDVESTVALDFDVEVSTLSIVELNATTAEFQVTEEDEEDGQIVTSTSTITLAKNTGSEPGIDATDLRTKWSMGSNTVYVNDVQITADILDAQWIETVASIGSHRYTFDLTTSTEVLSVDNYMTGSYDEGTLEVLDRSNFVVELEGSEEPFLFHIQANSGTTDMSVVHFRETDQVDIKIEQDWTSNFTTPSLTALLIDGNWEVTAKSEGREVNGQVATPGDEGPQVGNVITFFSNGSGVIGQDQFTFEFIDDNNIALVGAGETEYNLIHFEAFNGTNELTIWNLNSGWDQNNTTFEQDWIQLDLVKQE